MSKAVLENRRNRRVLVYKLVDVKCLNEALLSELNSGKHSCLLPIASINRRLEKALICDIDGLISLENYLNNMTSKALFTRIALNLVNVVKHCEINFGGSNLLDFTLDRIYINPKDLKISCILWPVVDKNNVLQLKETFRLLLTKASIIDSKECFDFLEKYNSLTTSLYPFSIKNFEKLLLCELGLSEEKSFIPGGSAINVQKTNHNVVNSACREYNPFDTLTNIGQISAEDNAEPPAPVADYFAAESSAPVIEPLAIEQSSQVKEPLAAESPAPMIEPLATEQSSQVEELFNLDPAVRMPDPLSEKPAEPSAQATPNNNASSEFDMDIEATVRFDAFGTSKKSILIRRKDTSELFEINKPVFLIGRDRNYSDYCVPVENKTVGRKHAKIISENENFFIVDLESRNGSFVNNKQLQPGYKYELFDKDVIRLADVEFIVNIFQLNK